MLMRGMNAGAQTPVECPQSKLWRDVYEAVIQNNGTNDMAKNTADVAVKDYLNSAYVVLPQLPDTPLGTL